MSAFHLFIEVLFIFIGEKETLRGKILICFRMRCITPSKVKGGILLWWNTGVSASLCSCFLHVEGRSLGEMWYHYVTGASDRDFNEVMSTYFWSHDDEGFDTDSKTLRNFSVTRCKTITDLLAAGEEKKLLEKSGCLIFLGACSLILLVGLNTQGMI